jgi:cell division protein FtsB
VAVVSDKRSNQIFELAMIALIVIFSFLLFSQFDLLKEVVNLSTQYEHYEIDEIVSTLIVLSFCMIWFSYKRWRETFQALAIIEIKNNEIQHALDTIKILEGIIPICMHCKDIRDDKGAWHSLEEYISQHTDTTFSHGLCAKCKVIHYPD